MKNVRRNMWDAILMVLILKAWHVESQISSQNDLDTLASNLLIRIEVVENLKDGSSHEFKLTINNNSTLALSGSNWEIYFYSFFIVEHKDLISSDGLATVTEGYVIPTAKIRIRHENGCLFSMSPATGFIPVQSKETRVISFSAQNWAVSKTDVPPNWYLSATGFQAKVLESTSGDFVGDFTTSKQWKRMEEDKFNPFTLTERYDRYEPTNQNVQQKFVIPTPKEIVHLDTTNNLVINSCAKIVQNGFDAEAAFLTERVDFEIKLDCTEAEILLLLNNTFSLHESYELSIAPSSKEITIEGKTNAGIFYGIQTLLSLLSNSSVLPSVHIMDEPRYIFRGMHIDVARNFMPKTVLMKLMDGMAMYKLNKLHLHLTDDEGWRIEINGLPELTEIGSKRCHTDQEHTCLIPQLGSGPDKMSTGSGFYSKQDYIDILQYAKNRHIEVIPEIDMPGHARAAIKAMEGRFSNYSTSGQLEVANEYRLIDPNDNSRYLSVQNFNDNAMDPCINSTYAFIEKVLTEIISLHQAANHPFRIFHFGGDEVARTAWVNSTACQSVNIDDTVDDKRTYLKAMFAERVAKIAFKYGLNIAGWEDGLHAGGGVPFNRTRFQNADVLSNAWDNVWEWGEARRAYNFANDGYKVIMSHATHLYFDHPHEPDPEERGLYWATRFTDSFKTFGFLPDRLYENIDVTRMGAQLSTADVCGDNDQTKCPSLRELDNIVGMQGHLWSETVLSEENFYHMIFPRLLALAERAWHKASWEDLLSKSERDKRMKEDWDNFATVVGKKEMLRLDKEGIKYRVPPPGLKTLGGIRKINSAYPGLVVEYSTDNLNWNSIQSISASYDTFFLRTRSADGNRTSRTVDYSAIKPTGKCNIHFVSISLLFICLVFSFLKNNTFP